MIPLLKKPGLDLIFKNYRPISNLSFVSKLIERAVANQLLDHINKNSLDVKFQSAYKKFHSTETALIRVQNDLLMAMDGKKISILVLLDLSAAFDTVDICILLERLQTCFGITGTVLSWFRSYLSDRCQRILIKDQHSSFGFLKCGVPQGSVLGPILFSMYIFPISMIIDNYGLGYHLYADDSQLYLSLEPSSHNCDEIIRDTLVACICDIQSWMYNNKLKFNSDKTEIMLIGKPQQLSKFNLTEICVGGTSVQISDNVRNLGAQFDNQLSMDCNVASICKSSFYNLHRISQIRNFLSVDTTEILVNALITSRLDYCNSLLYGISGVLLSKLQRVQNAAARLISGSRKRDHITPHLMKLHWLPVKYRIIFKILLIVFKSRCGQAPSYINDMLCPYSPERPGLRSSSQSLLAIPNSNLMTCGDRAFSVAAPALWNDLPLEIKQCPNVNVFKSKLKTHLFSEAFVL